MYVNTCGRGDMGQGNGGYLKKMTGEQGKQKAGKSSEVNVYVGHILMKPWVEWEKDMHQNNVLSCKLHETSGKSALVQTLVVESALTYSMCRVV